VNKFGGLIGQVRRDLLQIMREALRHRNPH
jgi:hypothetical protein